MATPEEEEFEFRLRLEQEQTGESGGSQPQQTPQAGIGVWGALAVPEQLSREGLTQLSEMVPKPEPTGNLPMDVLYGAPRIAAETLAEGAPSFISRESIVGGVAAKALPLVGMAGRYAGKGLEAISGLEYKTPGILSEAAKDAGLIFAKGREAAKPMFAGLTKGQDIRPAMLQATKREQLLEESINAVRNMDMTPAEALIARRNLDKMRNSMPEKAFRYWRDIFDNTAKTVSREADAAYSRGIKADELRRFLPVNKMGGTSIAKSALGSIAGLAPLAVMSPLLQGAAATIGGLGYRGASTLANIPRASSIAMTAGAASDELLRLYNAR